MFSIKEYQESVDNVLAWLSSEYKSIQTGRASPVVLDNVSIEQYGSRMPIMHVATINIEDPKTLRVVPFDKGAIKDIEKSVYDADLGLSVSIDDGGLRIHFPALTTETRAKMVKVLKDKQEEARVRVRSVREDANKSIENKKKNGELSEDEAFRSKDEVQEMVNTANSSIEGIFSKKENEVMNQ